MPQRKSLSKNSMQKQNEPKSDRSTLYKLIVIIIRRILFYCNNIVNRFRFRSNSRRGCTNHPTNRQLPSTRMIVGVLVVIVAIIAVVSVISLEDNQEQSTPELPVITYLADTDIGNVYKDGPYGNTSSNVTIALILGVHPRENGSHVLMEEALKSQQENLHYSYYLYHVNVTQDASDFNLSREHGQSLANQYVVNDVINNNFNLAMDVHFSDGSLGYPRFMFTSVEDNVVSNRISHDITNNFDWIEYYAPKKASSPEFVMTPLNNAGIPTILYEAYTRDDYNLTLEHDKQMIQYIDNYNFTTDEEA